MNKIADYQNGNTRTTLYDDGTKIHYTDDDSFKFAWAESCDIQISQCCDNGCDFCYAGCAPTGKHGKLTDWKFFGTMHPYTEIAINLQFPTPPDLMEFLYTMKARQIFVNVTINQRHFMSDYGKQFVTFLVKMGLIKGIGVSLVNPTEDGFIEELKKYPNAIVHVVAGVISPEDIVALGNHGLKLLILGYKQKGRGVKYFINNNQMVIDNIAWLESCIMDFADAFDVVSFDNLALEQLHMKEKMSEKDWELYYAGEDGTVTFYIDLVSGRFAKSSLSDITYPIGDKSIDEMFWAVRRETDEAT